MAKPVLGKSVRSDWFLLGRDFAVRTVSWKRSKPCTFVLEQSRQIQNLQPKQRKKNVNIVILHRETSEKAKNIEILLRFQRWMKKTNIFRVRSILSWTSGAFDSETETGISESQEAIDDFINQQKSANTNKKNVTDMITLLRYIEANGMKNEKIESLPASELDHYLSKFVWTDGGKTEKNKSQRQSPVSAWYRLTAILRKNIRLTYPRTMSSKNPEKSLQRS